MREQNVVVAVVADGQDRFLVTYNAKWGGYAFPMTAVPEGDDVLGSQAVRAVERDLGLRLADPRPRELDYMGCPGNSQRTREDTLYRYWLYDFDPRLDITLPTGRDLQNPPLFLPYADLAGPTRRTDLTWSTSVLAREFVENQDAVLAVITRAGAGETEYLVVENHNYHGYFFPTQRVTTEVYPDAVARDTIRHDLGYAGPTQAALRGEIPDVHFSTRYNLDRRYRFHVCEVQLPDVDLRQPGSALEQALVSRGHRFLWLPGSRLNDPAITFSPTMNAVWLTVVSLVPSRAFP